MDPSAGLHSAESFQKDSVETSSDDDSDDEQDANEKPQALPQKLQGKLKAVQNAVAAGGSAGKGLCASLLNQAAARWGRVKKVLLGMNRCVLIQMDMPTKIQVYFQLCMSSREPPMSSIACVCIGSSSSTLDEWYSPHPHPVVLTSPAVVRPGGILKPGLQMYR
jgi:hypothetical protein